MYNLKYISDNGNILNFSHLVGLVITNAQGLTENAINMATSQGVSQVGTTVQGESIQSKQIVITGEIIGIATSQRKHMLDTIVPGVGGTLIFDNRLQLTVRPQITPAIERKPANAKFQFTLYAPYPYWQAIDQVTTIVGGIEPKFKFPINYGATDFPDPRTHMFGQRIQTFFVNVINSGNVDAPFVVMFIAKTALSNPYITKVSTLEFIKINKSMVAGERITVDMSGADLKIISQVGDTEANAFQYFDIDSTLFKLDVGDNLIRYDADINRDGLDCRIIFRPTWAGAYGDDKTCV